MWNYLKDFADYQKKDIIEVYNSTITERTINETFRRPITQRQLRRRDDQASLGILFIREEAKIANFSTKEITVTEVRMSQDLKTAKIFVMPLGGKNSDEIVEKLKISSFVIRKILSKKIIMKYLPKLFFVKDNSFDYAEKIENLIKQTNK